MRKVVSVLILALFVINCSDENKEGLGLSEPDIIVLDVSEEVDL